MMSVDDIATPAQITARLNDAEDNAANQHETPPTSETDRKPTVIEALARVMGDVQAVGKNDRNQQQGFNFRGIDAVVNAAGPAFRRYGIVPTVTVNSATYRDLTSKAGNAMRECVVDATYRFYGPAGDWVESTVKGEAMDSGDKSTAKAHSVAYRTALLQTLCIPTHEPDPDEHSYERAGPAAAPPDPPDGYMWPKPAKDTVLYEAGGDIAMAIRAWTAAGLDNRDHVTPDERDHAVRIAHLYREQERAEPKPADNSEDDDDGGTEAEADERTHGYPSP